MRRQHTRAQLKAEINVVPYIDVMLVLLIIFMITAPILTQGITVDLPQALSQAIESANEEPIIVSVNHHGELFLNIHDNPEQSLDASTIMHRVAAEIKLAKESKQLRPVLVKGDRRVEYDKVIAVMNILKKSGVENIGLLTESPEEHA